MSSGLCQNSRGSFSSPLIPEASINSVFTGPGQTAVTLTPLPASLGVQGLAGGEDEQSCSPRTSPPFGIGWKAAVEAMLMTPPAPRPSIAGRKRLVRSMTTSQFSAHHLHLALAFG